MFSQLRQVVDALKAGQIVALIDDCSPLPSIVLLRDAARITEADITRFAVEARGVVCAAISEGRRAELGLPLMFPQAPKMDDSGQFEFTVSVEARRGVTTGISAADRATTLRMLAETTDPRYDLVTPGHIFPARAQEGGVLIRAAIAEACVDLLRLAGLKPTAAFVQCLDVNGRFLAESAIGSLGRTSRPSSSSGIDAFPGQEPTPRVAISDLIRYRLAHESQISRVAEARLPTLNAPDFRAICYLARGDGAEHLALVHGDPDAFRATGEPETILVRVQAESPLGDLFGTDGSRGLQSLRRALSVIRRHGPGVLVYIRHPRRDLIKRTLEEDTLGNTAAAKSRHGSAQALRELGVGAQILSDLGVRRAKILSNSRRDFSALAAFGIEVVGETGFPADSDGALGANGGISR